MDIKQPPTVRFGWMTVGFWIGLTFVGCLLGVALHFPGDSDLYSFDKGAATVGFLFGAVSGLMFASLQWIILRNWLRTPWLWFAATMVGWGLVHAINDGIALPRQQSFVYTGVIMALTQYVALRPLLTRALLWIPITAIAWFSGFQLGDSLYHGEDPGNLVAAGLTVGVITGLSLRFLILPIARLLPTQGTPSANRRQMSRRQMIILIIVATLVAFYLAIVTFGLNPL